MLHDLDVAAPPLGSIGIGQLIAGIDRAWDTRVEIRETVSERLPALRERARRTSKYLVRLLQERLPDRMVTLR